MATALDLLMSTNEDVNLLSEESDICTIDAKTRAIFVPSTIVVGGVQSDKNAERIKFSCPKIVGDNLDLSKFSVRINFENVSSVDLNVSIKDQYICDDVAVDGENVTFSWLIGRNAARYMGTVRFIVCAVKTDSDSNISVEWNTAIAEVPVLEGIEIDQPQIGQEEKDVINQLLELTKNTSAEAVQNVNSAKEQAIKDIQSVSQPDTTLTVEGGLAEAKATGEAIGSLKKDLDNTNGVLNIDAATGTNQSVSGWKLVKIIEKDVKANNTYEFVVTLSSEPTSSTYIYIKEKGNNLKNFQVKGLKFVTYEKKFTSDSNVTVEISSESYTGYATAEIQNKATNKIDALETAVFRSPSLTARPLNELFELVQGGVNELEIGAVKYRVATKNVIYFPDDIILTVSNGFRVGAYIYDSVNPTTFDWSTWKSDTLTVKRGFARIQIARLSESTGEIADVNEFGSKVLVEYKKIKDISPDKNAQFYALFNGEKYFSHIDVDYYDGLIIPSQSIFDIRRAKRLGFNAIELNARKTSDGVFYAFHGHQNCFGNAFHAVDNSDISNINVSAVTSEYIQKNIRYNSKYEKYRTVPTTLEDALIECKINNIVPVVEISDGNVDIVKSIMGENNYIFGIYDKDRTNELKNCVVSGWLTGTADEMIEKANISNQPYICAINVTDSMYKNYGNEDWKKLIKKIHEAGYFVSCSYQTPAVGEKLLSSGIDIMASKGEINDFSYGNLFDSESGMDFSDFTSDGNALNGMLNLTDGQTVKPTGIDNAVFLGGSSLHIIFSGKIHIQMGIVDNDFESDGKKEIWLSSFYQEAIPTFLITSVGNSTILELSYKASKM